MGNGQGSTELLHPSAPVALHIYDANPSGPVHALNKVLRPLGTGVFHCGVEIYGLEWSYSRQGIFSIAPRSYIGNRILETVCMGKTSLSDEAVLHLVMTLKKDWPGSEYHLLLHNCCHFSDGLCKSLGVGGIPTWITSLASAGEAIANPSTACSSDQGSAAGSNGCGWSGELGWLGCGSCCGSSKQPEPEDGPLPAEAVTHTSDGSPCAEVPFAVRKRGAQGGDPAYTYGSLTHLMSQQGARPPSDSFAIRRQKSLKQPKGLQHSSLHPPSC